jgi:hypothetical protein
MPRPLRLLKVDSAHPHEFLAERQRTEAARLRGLSYEDYYRWVTDLRIGLSDYLTHPMNEAGWTAREFNAKDPVLLSRLSKDGHIEGISAAARARFRLRHLLSLSLADTIALRWCRGYELKRRYWLIERYIETFKPDVLFIREPCNIDGEFFHRFRDRCLVVSFIGCSTDHPQHWNPHRNDVIFTLTDEYLNFFKAQGIETHRFEYGVDARVYEELKGCPKEFGCTFVGYLGQPHQSRKTEFLETVAGQADFQWWGVKGPAIHKYPALERTWRGETAGIDMLKIYRQSKVVLNDYADFHLGAGVNMRTTEVLNVGTCLLTRQAPNLAFLGDLQAIATFKDTEDCVTKIRHLLAHEEERERIAAKGLQVALERFNYRDVASHLMDVISEAHERKRPRLKSWRG